LEPYDFSVLDVENLRLHYAQTLRHWLRRFEDTIDWTQQRFGERFVRMWRMYLVGSIAGFESGSTQLFQMLFARGGTNQIPWTRSRLAQPVGPPSADHDTSSGPRGGETGVETRIEGGTNH
jgi:cyclopropane-fatty-acyl-phospholipid synthase